MPEKNFSAENSGIPIARIHPDGRIEVLLNIHFQCTSCGLCCEINRIPVREDDVAGIQKLGYDIDQFLSELSPVLFPSKNIEGNFIKAYIMKKKPFTHDCVFLTNNKRCRIHSAKPLGCKTYPFALRKEQDSSILVIIHPNSVCKYIEMDSHKTISNTKKIVEQLKSIIEVK